MNIEMTTVELAELDQIEGGNVWGCPPADDFMPFGPPIGLPGPTFPPPICF